MKKLFVLLCVGAMAAGLVACGNKNEQGTPSTEQTQETSTEQQSPQTQETQPEETTESSAESDAGMDAITGWSEEMNGIRQVVVDTLGENYWPNMQVDAEMLEMTYGITPDMYDDYLAEMPMISTNVDTLLIVKAKEDKVAEVEAALNAYRDTLVEDTMQYPQNLGKIQASRIQTYGNFVCFVQLGGEFVADDTRTEAESLTLCQEQNELALEVIGKNIPR